MDITYSQTDGVKIVSKGMMIIIDGPAAIRADVVLSSKPLEAEQRGLTTFDGPGEYEVRGCMIDGIVADADLAAFGLDLEDIKLSYLPILLAEAGKNAGSLTSCDVLFVPLADSKTEEVAKLVSSFESKIVIPVMYNESELKGFLAEMGAKDVEPVEKLKLGRKDLEEDKQSIVVLKG